MGFNDFITSVLSGWRKRKRNTNDEETIGAKKVKHIATYTLTPMQKENKVKESRNSYVVGEELESTESRVTEYKEGGCLFKREVLSQLIRKYGCAFLNSEGGTLLAGVNDRGIVRGLYVSTYDFNSIADTLRDEMEHFRPSVPRTFYSIRTIPVLNQKKSLFHSKDELCVVEISFKKGVVGELYEDGEHCVYLRRDGGVQGPLRPLDIKNFVISNYINLLKDRKTSKNNSVILKDNKENLPSKDNRVVLNETKENKVLTKEEALKQRLAKKNITYITID